jgi:hypothetical protein
MKTLALCAVLSALSVPVSLFASRVDQDPQPTPQEVQAMMEKAKRFTQPGPSHRHLERFVGEWTTESRLTMGGKASPAEMGTASGSWLMPGRWLRLSGSGRMMGMAVETFHVLGYDNFKQSFVTTTVTSVDTAMLRAEGDLTPDGKALITYGTLDEYLTGEHDKMVRYVWRFLSDDEIVLEIHDLPIGEVDTKVVETRFLRKR